MSNSLSVTRRLLALALLLGAVRARAEFFEIERYDVDITVRADAMLSVDEKIRVRFQEPRHGIFRKFPVRYQYAPGAGGARRPGVFGGTYSYSVLDVSVENEPFTRQLEFNQILIRIGSPDRFVEGVKTYHLRYDLYGAINFFDDHSELYWNLVGTEWPVKIHQVRFAVHLPRSVPLAEDDYFVYTGARGERGLGARTAFTGRDLTGDVLTPLSPGEGVTVGVRLPKGTLHPGGLWLNLRLFYENNRKLPVAVGLWILAFLLWWHAGRDERVTIVPDWKAPEDINPAEAGLLLHEGLLSSDLTSLIFHWATMGYLKIEETTESGLIFDSTEYRLTRRRDLPERARGYEKTLFHSLFRGRDAVSTSQLKNTFYSDMSLALSAMKSEVFAHYYSTTAETLGWAMFAGFLGTLVWAFFTMQSLDTLNALYLALGGAGLMVFRFFMPKKTKAGVEGYRRVMGLKMFIERVEQPRLRAMLKEDPAYFDKTIAYAIVFGLGHAWATKFNGLLVEPPTWYVGSYGRGFSYDRFGSSLTSSMSSLNSSFVSQPGGSGSSGFGGGSSGGSSGGGGGGGGGGSW